MTTLREAAAEALKWFDWLYTGEPVEMMDGQKSNDIRQALRAALAEPDDDSLTAAYMMGRYDAKKAEQEPVAWQWLNTANFRKKLPADAHKAEWNPLYAAPQPRKRLTDEEIDALPWGPHEGNPMTFAEGLRDFARAVEAAVWGDGE